MRLVKNKLSKALVRARKKILDRYKYGSLKDMPKGKGK